MIEIILSECKNNGRTWTSRHRTVDAWQAVDRAVAQHFGRGAFFHRENGISVGHDPSEGTQYGQVFKPCRVGNGNTSLTDRISVKVG